MGRVEIAAGTEKAVLRAYVHVQAAKPTATESALIPTPAVNIVGLAIRFALRGGCVPVALVWFLARAAKAIAAVRVSANKATTIIAVVAVWFVRAERSVSRERVLVRVV